MVVVGRGASGPYDDIIRVYLLNSDWPATACNATAKPEHRKKDTDHITWSDAYGELLAAVAVAMQNWKDTLGRLPS